MRIVILAASASAGIIGGSIAVEAATLLPLADNGTPAVTLVAQGCGLGYSRGTYGHCRPSVFGFGVPGARRYGYGAGYGYGPRGYGYSYRPYGGGYSYRPYGYGY